MTYRLLKGQQQFRMATETSDSIRQTGEQVTLNRLVPLSSFAPGRYWLEVAVRDRVSGQSISRNAEFTLKAINICAQTWEPRCICANFFRL